MLFRSFTNGESSTGGTSDKRNNVEQVLISAPMAGAYTITVKATTIVQGPQDFALVVTGAFGSVTGGGGATDGGTSDAPTGDVVAPPPQDATPDQTTPPADATPDVSRPDGSGGMAGVGGGGGAGGATGGAAGAAGGSAGRGGSAGSAGSSGAAGAGGSAVDAGTSDASRADAAGGKGGSGGSGGSSDPTYQPPPSDDSGCSCSVPRRDESSGAGLLGLGLAIAAVARRPRR